MRCAVPYTFFAYPDGTGSALVQVTGMQLGADVAGCLPGELALLSYAELGNVTANPFRLDLVEAGAISSAVLLIWVIGFGIRLMLRTLYSSPSSDQEV